MEMSAWEDAERRPNPGRFTGEEVLFDVGMPSEERKG